jgi:hypothetical protein
MVHRESLCALIPGRRRGLLGCESRGFTSMPFRFRQGREFENPFHLVHRCTWCLLYPEIRLCLRLVSDRQQSSLH